jgi:membrane-anchored glycerophosphoryl diester phosphodiesterase (GDPDase)
MAKSKGIALFGFAIGLIVLFVGVALMYMLPELIINQLNNTTIFTAGTVATAQAKIDSVRGIGFVVIIIAVIWMLISVVAGKQGA